MGAFDTLLLTLRSFTAQNTSVFYPDLVTWTWRESGAQVGARFVEGAARTREVRMSLWDPTARTDERSRAAVLAPGFAGDVWLGEVAPGDLAPPVGATATHGGARLTVTTAHALDRASGGTPLIVRWSR